MLNVKTILSYFVLTISCSFVFGQSTMDKELIYDEVLVNTTVEKSIKQNATSNSTTPLETIEQKLIQFQDGFVSWVDIVTIEGKNLIYGIRRQEN